MIRNDRMPDWYQRIQRRRRMTAAFRREWSRSKWVLAEIIERELALVSQDTSDPGAAPTARGPASTSHEGASNEAS